MYYGHIIPVNYNDLWSRPEKAEKEETKRKIRKHCLKEKAAMKKYLQKEDKETVNVGSCIGKFEKLVLAPREM
ncbi:hypothetical protein NDU88_006833 [Pleurodeles waltl]|uniref:Uncharacterized protein n=1 Tax=Pleurodeles waltl TaxID=8319 RepID=A0AAV7X545_PLEWA|nr:hypothetical protein NDU88_006833 [Pleurodeles waltl]